MALKASPVSSSARVATSAETIEMSGREQRAAPTQSFNELSDTHIALARKPRAESVAALNQLLVDTMTLRDLYKKHHWQTSGATFYQLHLLFDKHHAEQSALIDEIAERIQTLGGIAIAMAADVAETTMLARPPKDREHPSVQLARFVVAHERILLSARAAARHAAEFGDDGTNDLLVSDVIRTNERQAWFIHEQLQDNRISLVQ